MIAITRLRAATAVAAAVALTLTACSSGGGGSKNVPGVTDTTVTIGSTDPLTGPAAPGYGEIAPAAQAFFNYVNASGGVNGRKVTLKYLDDAYNPTQTVTLTKQLVLQDKVFAVVGALGTPTHTKVEGKILGDYITKNFAGKKVAYFYQDDDFGRDGMKGLDKHIDQSLVVSRQPYQPGNTDVAAQVSAIARAKPDVVVLFTIPAYTALFKLTSLKLGFSPTMVVSNVGSDPITVSGLLEAFAKQAGASVKGGQLIEGIVTDTYLPTLGDTSNSWIALFKKVHDQYAAKLPFDGNVVYGMAYAYTFLQLLRAAGKNPTRQGVIDALEKGGISGPGLTPYRYSSSSHAGFTGVQVGTIQSGALVVSGTPMTTDDGDGPIAPYTTAPPAAPPNGIPAG